MLDSDLADLYGVWTKRLNEQVRRNIQRFPADFMFQLSPDEAIALRSQNATLEAGRSIGFRVEEGRPPYGKPRQVGPGRQKQITKA